MTASGNVGDDRIEILEFSQGERIFTQGEPGDCVYLVESGQVGIGQHIDGEHLDLDPVVPGEILGEMALFGSDRRMSTATAGEPCRLARIPTTVFFDAVEQGDRCVRAFVDTIIKNIRTSHRVFLRRPRSFRDHVRQMKAFSGNIGRFSARIGDPALSAQLQDALTRLDGALADMDHLAALCLDQRHDIVIGDAELNGVGLDAVVSSESRRHVYSDPPRRD